MASNRLKLCNLVVVIATLVLAVQQQQQNSGATFQLVTNCNCSSIGSDETSRCDILSGRCQCKNENITGLKCDKCRENHFDLASGCIECPECYRLVQIGVDIHKLGLDELIKLIDRLEKNPDLITDEKFKKALLDLVNRVNTLLSEAEKTQGLEASLLAKLANLLARLENFKGIADSINKHLNSTRPVLDEAVGNVTIAEDLLKKIREEVAKAGEYIRIQGAEAVRKAKERVDKLGQQSQKMASMAQESRQLADEHEKEAARIRDLYMDAMNFTSTAYDLAINATNAQEENAKNIKKLKSEIDRVNELLANTTAVSNTAIKEAKKSYDEALALYALINSLQLNKADIPKLKQQAAEILQIAINLRNEVEEIIRRHKQLLLSTQFKLDEMKALLAEAMRQQKIANAQLADIDKNVQKARDAVDRANKILNEAQGMLNKLLQFDQTVQISKKEAEKAIQKIPKIILIIETAENKTREANNKLGSALADAIAARDIAQQAYALANETSVYVKKIRSEAQELKTRIANLRAEAGKLGDNIKETTATIDQYEIIAKTDGELANQALQNANQASMSAKNATETAKKLLDVLNNLLKSIDKIEGIDLNKLTKLEEELAKLKLLLAESNLTAIADDLMAQRDKQKELMAYYHDLIEWLVKEVANVRAIRDSLPDKCFKRNRLEVPIHEN